MLTLEMVKLAFPEIDALSSLAGGAGGQKDVLAGKMDGSEVVLKLIRPPRDPDKAAEVIERTGREIDAVRTLALPNVPQMYDHGQRTVGSTDRLYIVEERVRGTTLRSALQAARAFEIDEAVRLTRELLLAVTAFEEAHLVHRDIKPENLMLGPDGKLWILDFGLVRFLDMRSITGTMELLGPCTPGYGAPEQIRNLKPQIDSRADLFSVGVLLYEMLQGRNPHLVGKTHAMEVLQSVLNTDLPRLSGDTESLADFTASMAARYPSRRPRRASAALEWLSEISGASKE